MCCQQTFPWNRLFSSKKVEIDPYLALSFVCCHPAMTVSGFSIIHCVWLKAAVYSWPAQHSQRERETRASPVGLNGLFNIVHQMQCSSIYLLLFVPESAFNCFSYICLCYIVCETSKAYVKMSLWVKVLAFKIKTRLSTACYAGCWNNKMLDIVIKQSPSILSSALE